MSILIVIFLAIIAYFLWRIYRQKEEEREQVASEKFELEWEAKKKEEFKDYPNLIGKVDYTWLELFGKVFVEKEIPHMKAMFLIYLREANNTKLDMDVDRLFYWTWDLTEELLEHLERYHEGAKYEFEIALLTYWQEIAEAAESFVGKDIETITQMFNHAPFTDIKKIPSWFPKKDNHPEKEMSFLDEKDHFPRESKGSAVIHDRLSALGL